MSFAIQRAIAFALPILILPMAAQAAPKVGTVTSSNGAVISHDGKITPVSTNSPVFAGDKVMTLSGGSANVQFGDHTVKMGGSSMTDSNGSIISMNSTPKSDGLVGAKSKLANAISHDSDNDNDNDRGNQFGHCIGKGHDHHNAGGPGNGHGHGHDHDCPVSP